MARPGLPSSTRGLPALSQLQRRCRTLLYREVQNPLYPKEYSWPLLCPGHQGSLISRIASLAYSIPLHRLLSVEASVRNAAHPPCTPPDGLEQLQLPVAPNDEGTRAAASSGYLWFMGLNNYLLLITRLMTLLITGQPRSSFLEGRQEIRAINPGR